MGSIDQQVLETPWLNEEFIAAILKRKVNDAEISIVSLEIHNAVPKGDNYASLLQRVNFEYNVYCKSDNSKVTKKETLIVKSLPPGEFIRKWIAETGIFDHELNMYKETLPAIYELFQKRTSVEEEHLATRVFDSNRDDTIVLEDLRPLGYKMADRRQGLDLQQSIMAIRVLAKLHASSMVLYLENPQMLEYYKETMYTEDNRKMQEHFMDSTFNSLAKQVETWPGFERFPDKLRSLSKTAFDKLLDSVNNKEGAMKVLNHGDFWTNNMLFRYEDEKIADVKMLDFQMVRFASPAVDIHYFMHTSPSQNILEEHWDLLIKEYLESLNMTLKNLGDDRVVDIEDINKELKDKVYFGVIISCIFCIMVAEPEDAPDFSNFKEEDFESGEDSGVMDKAFAGKKFRSVMQKRLPKFEMDGLI